MLYGILDFFLCIGFFVVVYFSDLQVFVLNKEILSCLKEFGYFYRQKKIKDKQFRLLRRSVQFFVLQNRELWEEGWGNLGYGDSLLIK